ncbi:glycerol kinase GlpK [Coprothermobacter platensis]|uniref:glycerol kinase GlpK n=1 Tax=Coprothermobacter platensis TaxID=108819 RepID=UPI000367A972
MVSEHEKYVLSFDQGTTSSRSIVFNSKGHIVSIAQKEFRQIFPQPGWVEHDPEDIWNSQMEVAKEALRKAHLQAKDISALGIANQRETTILWDKNSGKPVYNAIVWQCRRTAQFCDRLKEKGWEKPIRDKTGLVIDAYFSGTKIKWILDNIPGVREKAQKGEVLFGNVDTFLIWRLTKGKVHVTDYTNASRTMIFNIHTLDWDDEILQELGIPRIMLPEVKPSSCIYGYVDPSFLGEAIPIAGDAGDQQAALFGQACFEPGSAKNTYGTGSFLLVNTGDKIPESEHGLITTIAYGVEDKVSYALEGSVFVTGAAVQWLRDGLKIIRTADEVETLASQVEDSGGVYFVPAFVGLGAPYWDMYARGTMVGITRGSNACHIARATLESIAFQTRDVLEAMKSDCGFDLNVLKADGGASVDNLLLQIQSDILGLPVQRPVVRETTALGAAYLAGLATGVWHNLREIQSSWQLDRTFVPKITALKREEMYAGWQRAVERARNWIR